ncbi:hypothetical protein ES703_102388 [subsurface metagenome]
MANLGEELKERREARNLSLRQLSRMTGVHITTLSHYERGERFPSGRILWRLAEPLGFTEIELLKLAGFLSQDA